MSEGYDNNMSGAIFKNEKRRSENSPDYTGQCEIDGTEYWMSAWIKTPRSGGKKFMSLAFTQKDVPSNTSPAPTQNDIDFDDEVPF